MKVRIITRVVPGKYVHHTVTHVVQCAKVDEDDIDYEEFIEWVDKGSHDSIYEAEQHVRLLLAYEDKVVKTYG